MRLDAASAPFPSGNEEPREEEEAEEDPSDDDEDDERDPDREDERGREEGEYLPGRFEDFEGGREPRSPDDEPSSFLGL